MLPASLTINRFIPLDIPLPPHVTFERGVVCGAGGLDQREGDDHDGDDGDVLADAERLVHLQPAVVHAAVVVVLEAHGDEHDERRQPPADQRVLHPREQAVLPTRPEE